MNEFEVIRRVWNTSRTMVQRLEQTRVQDLKVLLAKVHSDCDSMSVAQLLNLSAPCQQINTLTDQVADYPQTEPPQETKPQTTTMTISSEWEPTERLLVIAHLSNLSPEKTARFEYHHHLRRINLVANESAKLLELNRQVVLKELPLT